MQPVGKENHPLSEFRLRDVCKVLVKLVEFLILRLGDGASRPSSIRAILKPPVTETMIGRSGATYGF
jgi:hypothetical protein